jgi:hypothetical protein
VLFRYPYNYAAMGNAERNNGLALRGLFEEYRLATSPDVRKALQSRIDLVMNSECRTPSTDALERHGLLRLDHEDPVVKESLLKRGRKALMQGYAAPRGDELMRARIARRDPTCQGDQFVGGWGWEGLKKIAGTTTYTHKQLEPKTREPLAAFLIAVDARGRFITPSSVSCVSSVFWATCPLSGQLWDGDMRLETRANRQCMAPGWSAGTILHVSGPT